MQCNNGVIYVTNYEMSTDSKVWPNIEAHSYSELMHTRIRAVSHDTSTDMIDGFDTVLLHTCVNCFAWELKETMC